MKVDVVTCYDCAHKYSKDFYFFCPYFVGPLVPDGYCHYGISKHPLKGKKGKKNERRKISN